MVEEINIIPVSQGKKIDGYVGIKIDRTNELYSKSSK